MRAAEAPGSGLTSHWVDKAGRLLRRFRYEDTNDRLVPFLQAAEEVFPAMVEEVAVRAGGSCGIIDQRALANSALIGASGEFLMAMGHADPTSRGGVACLRTGAKFLESSTRMAQATRDQAIILARSAPAANKDLLAAFDVPAEPEEPDGV